MAHESLQGRTRGLSAHRAEPRERPRDAARGLDVVTFRDWKKIEAAEEQRARDGAPREKFTSIEAMLAAIGAKSIDDLFVDVPEPAQRESVDIQLAAYRIAWAKLVGARPDQVRAAFHYVRPDVTLEPADLPDGAAEVVWLSA